MQSRGSELGAPSLSHLLCRRKKFYTALGGRRKQPGQELIIHRGHRVRPIRRGIEPLFKEPFQARWRGHQQDLRILIPGVLETMHNLARKPNKIASRSVHCLAADVNSECSLLEVKHLLFAMVN